MVPPSDSKPKIVIAGGTGYLGQLIAESFHQDNWDVVLLSRSSNPRHKIGRSVYWDAKSLGDWTEELENAQVLLNLTGRSIDCRHNAANREEILNSRVYSTRVLGEAVSVAKSPPPCWLNASSMALYGQLWGNTPAHTEQSSLQSGGFLEDVTVAWEEEFLKWKREGIRQVALRISFVLGRASGAFPLLKMLTKYGLGGTQGSGKQWVSWLHEKDWVGIIRVLVENENMNGAVNLAAPNPLMNKEFMKALRSKFAPLGIGFPAPSFGVKLGCFILNSAPELALQSRKVCSAKLKEHQYKFLFPEISEAFKNLGEVANSRSSMIGDCC
jgi:uncharacterized protein (TIGR01777 family)